MNRAVKVYNSFANVNSDALLHPSSAAESKELHNYYLLSLKFSIIVFFQECQENQI